MDSSQTQSDLCQIIKQERHILLVLNELCHQMVQPAALVGAHEEIDLLSVAHRLQESGMSVKQTQRCWELFRKRLRDVQKRESEFITAARQQITQDFCENQPTLFKKRLAFYDSSLQRQLSNDPGVLKCLVACETRVRNLLEKFSGMLIGKEDHVEAEGLSKLL